MAIHDREFSTPPASWYDFHLRLQLLAELGVGRLLRREQMGEDEAFAAALRQAG